MTALMGEDRDGYLDLRKPPTDPKYLAYAQGLCRPKMLIAPFFTWPMPRPRINLWK